ncbi:hypothetical protein LEP1GSC066_0794 [Leptospira sp. serovar Kenya str. Sh9]|nr:hypothetical protein LEP1GSC066_0794 [Leptospira sp. serovar Kenya str. Sh9]
MYGVQNDFLQFKSWEKIFNQVSFLFLKKWKRHVYVHRV